MVRRPVFGRQNSEARREVKPAAGERSSAVRRQSRSWCRFQFPRRRRPLSSDRRRPRAGGRTDVNSSLFTGPVFEMARDQLTVIADHLSIPEDERDWLLYPEARHRRHLSGPDGGQSDRGLHRISGPASSGARSRQGRHALRSQCRHQRNRRARHLDELEMRARRSSLRRRQGRRRGRPARAQAQGAREPQPPLHAGDDPLRRPAGRTSWRRTWAPTSR